MDASQIARKFDFLANRMDRTLPAKGLVAHHDAPSSGQNVAESFIDGYAQYDNKLSLEGDKDLDTRPNHIQRNWGSGSGEVAEIAEDRSSVTQVETSGGIKHAAFHSETTPDGSWSHYSLQYDTDNGTMRGLVQSGQSGVPGQQQQIWHLADSPSVSEPGPNATQKQIASYESLINQTPMIIADLLGTQH